jgi:hypothetical protein
MKYLCTGLIIIIVVLLFKLYQKPPSQIDNCNIYIEANNTLFDKYSNLTKKYDSLYQQSGWQLDDKEGIIMSQYETIERINRVLEILNTNHPESVKKAKQQEEKEWKKRESAG